MKNNFILNKLVIIPTYNEERNIENIIKAVFSLNNFHLLIIDDNSPDGTAKIVKNLIKHNKGLFIIEREQKLGLGTAYVHGFKWALENKYDQIFEMDADFSHNPRDLLKLSSALENADVAIGSRYISGINVVNWPLGRVLMSYLASVYVRMITGLEVMDTTAGFVGYKAIVLKTINLNKIKLIGYGFQIEMKFKAWKFGFKIVEIPIIFTERIEGSSKMSGGIFNEALLGVIRMKISSWFKKYPKVRKKVV